ncbi:nucleotide sugar dehydrogenase, partial [Halorubrum sp. Atlit-28R]
MSREHPGLYGSDRSPDEQTRALRAGEVPVAVYGLGKMGLPLAAVYARATGTVTGVDISEDVVRGVN